MSPCLLGRDEQHRSPESMRRSGRSGTARRLTCAGRLSGVGFADHLHSSLHNVLIEHAADVAVAGHATGTSPTGLRDTADRLRIVLGDRFANLVFCHV